MRETENTVTPARTRREFCVHACQAVSVLSLGSVLQSCGGSPTAPSSSVPLLPSINGTVTPGAVTIAIDAASPLSSAGSAALVQSTLGTFLVAHPAQGTFTALTAICTHEACEITGFESQMFVCPCHGSRYTTAGAVLNGPAPASLRRFATQFSNNILTITV